MYGNTRFCPHLNANGVGSTLIQTNAIQARHINGAVLSAGMIGAYEITATKFGTNSVTKRAMGALAVTNSILGTNSVNGRVLAADSVQTSHLGTNAVNGVPLAGAAVTNGHVKGTSLSLGAGTHGVGFGKLNALYFSVAFGTQAVTVGITHGLGRAAYGWMVVRNNKAGMVYEKANVATQLRLVIDGTAVTDAAVKVVVW